MSIWGRLFGKPEKINLAAAQSAASRPAVRHYEAAQTGRLNTKHWSYASGKDANSEISPALAILRQRCRYECRNNPWIKGIVDTLANDIAGDGPRLQITLDNADLARRLEDEFSAWADDADMAGIIGLADMARLAIYQLCESGEAIFIEQSAFSPGDNPYRLSIIEPDYLASPWNYDDENIIMGIKLNQWGRPVKYYFSQNHPGDTAGGVGINNYNAIDAEKIIHLFRQDRPEQSRGVPWLTPTLEWCAQFRRFEEATLTAAENAADISGIIHSNSPDIESAAVDTYDAIEFERGMMVTMPAGWQASQLRAEHPNATYEAYIHLGINKIARALNMPLNVALGTSQGYNYASGRLDWQVYYRFLATIRKWMERRFLRRVFMSWFRWESLRNTAYAGLNLQTIDATWFWPGAEHVDPAKEATAQAQRLANKTTTLAAECARAGLDWERVLEQAAREKAKMDELGLTPAPAPIGADAAEDTNDETDENQSDEDQDDADAEAA